jgi:hypothetical protein
VNLADFPEPPRLRTLLSFYHKFSWADELHRRLKVFLRRHGAFVSNAVRTKRVGSYEQAFRGDMYLCLWLGMLYVVAQAWLALRVRHPVITPLLRSPYKDLLREFRNATFHASDWGDPGYGALVQRGQASAEWAATLTSAFRHYLAPLARIDRELRAKA